DQQVKPEGADLADEVALGIVIVEQDDPGTTLEASWNAVVDSGAAVTALTTTWFAHRARDTNEVRRVRLSGADAADLRVGVINPRGPTVVQEGGEGIRGEDVASPAQPEDQDFLAIQLREAERFRFEGCHGPQC